MSLLDFFNPQPRNPLPQISRWVSDAWKEVSRDREFMVNTFRKTGLSLAIDGSEDGEMGFADVESIVVPQ